MIGPVAMVLVALLAARGDTICASSLVGGFLLEFSSDMVNAFRFRGKRGTFESQVQSRKFYRRKILFAGFETGSVRATWLLDSARKANVWQSDTKKQKWPQLNGAEEKLD
jgi:hypothetical protein